MIIGSCNGVAPNRRQAIALTKDDPGWWGIYASAGLNVFNHNGCYVKSIEWPLIYLPSSHPPATNNLCGIKPFEL